MSHVEFDLQASAIANQIPSLPEPDRIAAACRGSGNPAALSWLAEGLRLDESTTVIDLGAGLGGPSAWLHKRYGCYCINLEVAPRAAAANIFATPTICGCAEQPPLRTDSVDVALLLGVLSVVAHAHLVLREAARVAHRLGVLEYCSTTSSAREVGGGTFPTADRFRNQVNAAGWNIIQMAASTVPPPTTWTDAADLIDIEPEPTESEVIDAIQAGLISPFMLHAVR